jgi:hypothetical protein
MRGRVDDGEQILIALLFHQFIDLSGHRRRGRVAPGRVAKDEGVIELNFFHQRAGLCVIAFVFTGKADDDVGRNCHFIARLADAIDQQPIHPGSIRTMHRL